MLKPSLFVGSSTEGIEFARAVRGLVREDAEVTLWNEGVFNIGSTFIESLVAALPRFDFAALLLTPDDLVVARDERVLGPRDNVLFELGLFMGRLGRDRTFVIRPKGDGVKVPSDLDGLVVATYDWPRDDSNYDAAVGPACDDIRKAIRSLGPSPTKMLAQVHAVEAEQQRQKKEIDALAFVVAHFLPSFAVEHLIKLHTGDPFPYERQRGFDRELRHLWDLRFIEKKVDFKIDNMPHVGDLRDFFMVTDQGRTYLILRAQTASRQGLDE
jgi:hypothetical protein